MWYYKLKRISTHPPSRGSRFSRVPSRCVKCAKFTFFGAFLTCKVSEAAVEKKFDPGAVRSSQTRYPTSPAWWCGGSVAGVAFFSSPRHKFFGAAYASRSFGAVRGVIIPEKKRFISAWEGQEDMLTEEKGDTGGPGSVSVESAVITLETRAAESLWASPCLHITTPPTFSKETRSWLDWCLTEKKRKWLHKVSQCSLTKINCRSAYCTHWLHNCILKHCYYQ